MLTQTVKRGSHVVPRAVSMGDGSVPSSSTSRRRWLVSHLLEQPAGGSPRTKPPDPPGNGRRSILSDRPERLGSRTRNDSENLSCPPLGCLLRPPPETFRREEGNDAIFRILIRLPSRSGGCRRSGWMRETGSQEHRISRPDFLRRSGGPPLEVDRADSRCRTLYTQAHASLSENEVVAPIQVHRPHDPARRSRCEVRVRRGRRNGPGWSSLRWTFAGCLGRSLRRGGAGHAPGGFRSQRIQRLQPSAGRKPVRPRCPAPKNRSRAACPNAAAFVS